MSGRMGLILLDEAGRVQAAKDDAADYLDGSFTIGVDLAPLLRERMPLAEEALSLEYDRYLVVEHDSRALRFSVRRLGHLRLLVIDEYRAESGDEQDIARFDHLLGRLRELQGRERAKTVFLSLASHEMRTPLTAILGFCELLLLDHQDDAVTPSLSRIHQSARTLQMLTDRLLDFARVDAHIDLRTEGIDFEQLLLEWCEEHDLEVSERGLDFACRIPDGARGWRRVSDRRRLRQILDSLLDNALRFTNRGGIALELHRDERHARLRFDDSGCGVRLHDRERLFQDFWQMGDEQHHLLAAGVGLYIARRLASLLGGDIRMLACNPDGCSLELVLPLEQ